MKQEIKVLIIDNRPMVVQGIKTTLLSKTIIRNPISVDVAYTYEDAANCCECLFEQKEKFDIIIVDVDINYTNSKGLVFSEKNISKMKILNPNSKIILIIRKKDNYRISHIIKNIKPDGFILEKELDFTELQKVIVSVVNYKFYYSKTITKIIRKAKSYASILDDLDTKIIYCISKGVKTKNLTEYIPKSLSTLEKRKQKIKEVLLFNDCTDEKLIEEAHLRGIV
ncbi:MAG: hypothetical protein L3J08_01565 [Flavobacteriaceae bacterium]|nr:hypothetical protein [Flavobacteriaceae bacterium]